jgi:hypothetical protein
MKCLGVVAILLLLALPAARAHAQAGGDKEPPSPQKRYDALRRDFSAQEQKIVPLAMKAQGAEQEKLFEKYRALTKEFAAKFYQLAVDEPKSPVAADALLWVMQYQPGSELFRRAAAKLAVLVDEMPLKDLNRRVQTLYSSPEKFLESVYRRAEKEAQDPLAADLLGWIATNGTNFQVDGKGSPIGKKATDRLVEHYPDHRALERLCENLGAGRNLKAADTLKQIVEKSTKPRIKGAALLGLGRLLNEQTETLGDKKDEADKVAAEAEKLLTRATDAFGTDNASLRADAEKELRALRTLRVGKVSPEIAATDLDGKEFKLSDYRGKVVLLDFWGNW